MPPGIFGEREQAFSPRAQRDAPPVSDTKDLRARATAHAAQLLVEVLAEAGDAGADMLAVQVTDGVWEVRVQVLRCQQVSSNGAALPVAPARLTALDRRILAVAPREEVTMTRLAHLCDGHEPDSYFRGRVKRLVGAGRLVTEFGGYRLA